MAWIKVIGEEEASGDLKELYDKLSRKRGKVANIMKIHSLNPESMKIHMDLYLNLMFSRSGLTRAEREFMAVIVSRTNKCEYCFNHHATALDFYWRDRERIEKLRGPLEEAGLDERLMALGRYAEKLTIAPHQVTEEDVESLRRVGLSDEEILNVALIVSYFNFVNRMALGLGVEFNEEEVAGYRY